MDEVYIGKVIVFYVYEIQIHSFTIKIVFGQILAQIPYCKMIPFFSSALQNQEQQTIYQTPYSPMQLFQPLNWSQPIQNNMEYQPMNYQPQPPNFYQQPIVQDSFNPNEPLIIPPNLKKVAKPVLTKTYKSPFSLPNKTGTLCSFARFGQRNIENEFYFCKDCCGMSGQQYICKSCALKCHKGHNLSSSQKISAYCCCGAGEISNCACQCLNKSEKKT